MARRDRSGPYSLDMLRALPAPALFETDPNVLKSTLVTWFEGETGRTLYPMQVEMILIETVAYLWSLLGTEAQLAHRQRYTALADAIWLEQLGAGLGTPRGQPARALTTLAFALSAPASSSVVVPAGTRVSAGAAATVFSTDVDLLFGTGDTVRSVAATALEAGAAANAVAPGGLSSILDPVAGVASVANTTTTEGGADLEDVELYRLRVANALERVSGAGPRAGYAEDVMAVSAAIIDVAVVRPAPCYIDIYPLTASGPAGPDLRAFVAASLDPETERPMGDEVTVKPPVAVTYAIVLAVRARRDLGAVQSAALAVAQDVTARWRRALGASLDGGISDTDIIDRVRALPNVVHCEVAGLDYLAIGEAEFPVCTGITVNVTQAGTP